MLSAVNTESKIVEIKNLISESNRIVLICHVSPDGDAIGSSLALAMLLRKLGKITDIVTPDQPPKSLSFLPGVKNIVSYSCSPQVACKLFSEADLVICLDFNALSRIDNAIEAFNMSNSPKILIDHHLNPENFAQVIISEPSYSSTCLLLYRVIKLLEYTSYIDENIATCIYTGMVTDTGNFSYNSLSPEIYLTIAELLQKGLQKDEVYKCIYNSNTESKLRLNGYAISNKMYIYHDHAAGFIALTESELNKYNYTKGDTEGLVNIPLSIPGIVYSAFLRESVDANGVHFIKVSMRSSGEFPVNTICERYFNGGGHKNAAGGEFYGSINDALNILHSLFDENDKLIKQLKTE